MQKRGDKTCGQCSVAMITGRPLGEVIKKYGHESTTNLDDAKKVLNEYGYKTGNIIVADNRKKYILPQLAFVRIERIGREIGHFVVHYDGKFYDSCEGIFNSREEFMGFYKKRKWRIRHYIEVIRPLSN